MSKNLKNKTEGIPAVRLNFQTNGASGLSQPLNFPTSDGEESVAGANQNFLSHAFPQAEILQPKQDGKMSANADVENPNSNRGGYSQFLQALGEEGETKPMTKSLRSSADNATIEIYPYIRQDLKSPEVGKQILTQLYWQEGLSQRGIAEVFGVTKRHVRTNMEKFKVPRRDKLEAAIKARTKHKRMPFIGSEADKAYMLGIRTGDFYARKHGRGVDVTISTTHPAMLKLFNELFSLYSHVYKVPKFQRHEDSYEWQAYCRLHPSFNFLKEKQGVIPIWIMKDNDLFLHFMAGYFDAEGSIYIGIDKRDDSLVLALRIDSQDLGILNDLKEKLTRIGYHPTLRPNEKKHGYSNRTCWNLRLRRKNEAIKLAQQLPLSHSEKLRKRQLMLEIQNTRCPIEVEARVQMLRRSIRSEAKQCVEEARKAWLTKHPSFDEGAGQEQPTLLLFDYNWNEYYRENLDRAFFSTTKGNCLYA